MSPSIPDSSTLPPLATGKHLSTFAEGITGNLLDLVRAAIIVRDLEHGTILFWNSGAEEIYGWTKEEAAGASTHALLRTQFPQALAVIYGIVAREGSWSGELQHTTRTGEQIVVQSHWIAIAHQGVGLQQSDVPGLAHTVLEVNTDITVHKAAEQERRRAEARYRTLLEAAPDAIVACDAGGRILLVNSQTEVLFGYRREALIGRQIEVLLPEPLHALHARHRAAYVANPRTRPMGSELELYARRQDGSLFPCEVSLSPASSEGETLITAVIRDISARKAAEAALRARDEFLSVAAHELKTPLTGLRGFAQILLTYLKSATPVAPERIQRVLGQIEMQTDKVNRLVDQLLDVTRMESGRLSLDRRLTNLSQMAQDVATAAQPQTRGHTITVTAPRPAWAVVDALRLEQVLVNLVSNAIKYSPEGGVIEVAVMLEADDHTVALAVRDHGVGIPVEHRAKIFDRFYQAHAGSLRSGLGLGLYISREIIALHGGQLVAEFPPDGGSLFMARLPLDKDWPENTAKQAGHAIQEAPRVCSEDVL